MSVNKKEVKVLRGLANKVAEIANLSIQDEKISMWERLNSLKSERPLVCMDQLPWNELNYNGSLTCECEDEFLRYLEMQMRMIIYKWDNFKADMVVEKNIAIPKTVKNIHLGPPVKQDLVSIDATNAVKGHKYYDVIPNNEVLESLKAPMVEIDQVLDTMRFEMANEIFGDIIPAKLRGVSIHLGLWDILTSLRGPEVLILDLIDRPEFMHDLINRFVAMQMNVLDQMEELNLLDTDDPLIHCTGAFVDKLPHKDHPTSKDVWAFGLAQIFSTVSPMMFEEFEIEPLAPLFDRFGLIYYGCCEPLYDRINLVKKIKNVRKISVSPWADKERSAEQLNGDYVFSNKPNPAFLASPNFDEEAVRADLKNTVDICRKYNTPCEIILKDVSTVAYQPQRLQRWYKIAMEVVGEVL